MPANWVKIYSTTLQHMIQIVQAVLEENEIESVELNKQDSSYQMFGNFELYISPDNVVKAKHIIEKNEL
jgi:hypothetical protein